MSYNPYEVWDTYFERNPSKVIDTSPTGVVISGLDSWGMLIKRESYGHKRSKFGWDVDHIQRRRDDGTDDLGNLRPLYIQNNRLRN